MHQAVVEVGTDICADADEAFIDVSNLRKTISGIADDLGFCKDEPLGFSGCGQLALNFMGVEHQRGPLWQLPNPTLI